MDVYIVGIGMGDPKLLTYEAQEIIAQSDCLIGAKRMLDIFTESRAFKFEAVTSDKIIPYLEEHSSFKQVAVLASGDVGFYSIARTFPAEIKGNVVRRICGIGSLQYFCAKIGVSWDDVKIVSLHGREANLPGIVAVNEKTFVLTGGDKNVSAVCRQMESLGFGRLHVWVGERLSYDNEKITEGTVSTLIENDFDSLAVMLMINESPRKLPITHGLSDEYFLRGHAPMTKSEIRTISISKLHLKKNEIVWDIGAGTGSVCVEIARIIPEGAVYAVEKDTEALELLKENKTRFHTGNLSIIDGVAPDILSGLPTPDAVFIGGSSGKLAEIFNLVFSKNKYARIVVNAITLETLCATLECFKKYELPNQDIVQLSCARSKNAGKYHMMTGQNPIYILSGGGKTLNEA